MPADPSPAAREENIVQQGIERRQELSEASAREGAMEGVLIACGELGYRQASVRTILDYSGGHRVQFYKDFDNKDDCFAQAYDTWIERLGVTLLVAAAGAAGWQAGVRAALVALFRFVEEKPAIARALFVEVQVAGGPALAKHEEAIERLTEALDGVRATIEPEDEPPEATGFFVIGGIDACVREALSGGEPERVWDALPELMHLAVGSYLGKEAGEAAAEEARAVAADERARAKQVEG